MRWTILLGSFVFISTLLSAQTAPVKMGLWEKTLVMTGGPAGDRTIKAKSCVTPDTWKEMVGNASKQQSGCTNNIAQNAHGYTFDGTCTLQGGGSVVIHGTTTIQDSDHIVSETHSTSTRNGQKHDVNMHSTSRFLSSDCGKVKPGDPEVEE